MPRKIQPKNHFFKTQLMERSYPICSANPWCWCIQQHWLLPWLPQTVTLVFFLTEPCTSVCIPIAGWTCQSPKCSVEWGKLAESPEKVRLSQKDAFIPTLVGYTVSNGWSHPHSTWTYRSFVLYRRAANRLAIRCHTPAVSSVGMALHLFNKTKSRHFISHYHQPPYYNPASYWKSQPRDITNTRFRVRRFYRRLPLISLTFFPSPPPLPKERWFFLLQLL